MAFNGHHFILFFTFIYSFISLLTVQLIKKQMETPNLAFFSVVNLPNPSTVKLTLHKRLQIIRIYFAYEHAAHLIVLNCNVHCIVR